MKCRAAPELVTMQGWWESNKQQCRSAKEHQQQAELAVGETEQAGKQADETAHDGRHNANRRLEERIRDLEFRQSELERQKTTSVQELDILLVYKKRVEEALGACLEPLAITRKCIQQREGRIGVELVDDQVLRCLQAEERTLIQAQSKLRQVLGHASEQARLLRATQYALDMDVSGKEHALNIDRHCARLSQDSSELSSMVRMASTKSSSLAEWDFHTRQNITASNHQVKQSRKLRSDVNLQLDKVHEEINEQYEHSNSAFNKRIKETKEAKAKLENELAETTRQANVVRSALTQLEEPMAVTAQHIALASTRLSQRAGRAGIEQCRDAVEVHLNAELGQLYSHAENLKRQQEQAEASLRCLRRSVEQLTEDLNKKINTLMIDEVLCMTQRLSMNFHLY